MGDHSARWQVVFKRSISGRVSLILDHNERQLLANLFNQSLELLEIDDVVEHEDPFVQLMNMDGPTEISSDNALARLFPDAYQDDAEASRDFRRYTEPDLRRAKLENVRLVLDVLDDDEPKVQLSPTQVQAWLLALNDLRLILGTRIGVGEEDSDLDSPDDLDDDGTAQDADPGLYLYDYLTYLQEMLIQAL